MLSNLYSRDGVSLLGVSESTHTLSKINLNVEVKLLKRDASILTLYFE